MVDMGIALPKISIVTPSFNRRRFLEDAMQSVLGQGYPALEYVVVDGGSTDGSAEIISTHSEELAWWVSEPDAGPWDAVNKGFEHSTGEVMGWLGSDDLLMPWALSVVGELFASFPEIEWLTTLYQVVWDGEGRAVRCFYQGGYSRASFFRGENLPAGDWHATGWIQQESTFWRRALWERTGGTLDPSLRLAADFDLWARFFAAGADLYGVATPLGGFRMHGDQASANHLAEYVTEARAALLRHGGRIPHGVPSRARAQAVRAVPRRFRRLAAAAGLGFPEKLCIHDGPVAGWQIETR